jgi:YXWGXW repeat-containing protein
VIIKVIARQLLALCVLSGSAIVGAQSRAAEIFTDTPPPAPRTETVPAPRAGLVWAPGYWNWNGRFYAWVSGTWIAERRGKWIPDRWQQGSSHWRLVAGHWER